MKQEFRYMPLSDDIRARTLYVIAGGHARIPPNTPYPLPSHPADHAFQWKGGRTLQEYALVYITRGTGMFESKTIGRRSIVAGTLFVLFPGEWHRYRPDAEAGWDEYWLAFQGTGANDLVTEHCLSPSEPLLDVGIDEVLVADFLRFLSELREERFGYQAIIEALAALILARAKALVTRNHLESSEILPVIERVKCLFLDSIDQTLNMESVAADLGVGYSWFRGKFRAYTGMSPAQYHLQLRISHACALLRSTTLPISTIGARTGFDSPYYFARIFREKMGCSPREYRVNIHTPVQDRPSR